MRSSNVWRSAKTYASSSSPARWARVVQLRLSQRSGSRSTSARTMVPFPTPPGPETTMISGSSGVTSAAVALLGELIQQRLLLLRTEALDAAVVGDADVFHDLAGLDLADARQGLEQGDDLQLADGGVGGGERFGKGDGAELELILQLCPRRPSFGSLRQCGGSLL